MTINYIDKGRGLTKLLKASGLNFRSIDNVLISDDDTAVQAIIDSYDPLPPALSEAITQVKQKAYDLIIAKLPEWKQRNLMAESIDLIEDRVGNAVRLAELKAMKSYPDQVRAASDVEEARLSAITEWQDRTPDFSGMEAIA